MQKNNLKLDDIYTVGGNVTASAGTDQNKIYVKRETDDRLLAACLEGELTHILTSRQVGKSSLMVQTHIKLNSQEGYRSVVCDFNAIGAPRTPDEFYKVILRVLIDDLSDAGVDLREQRKGLGAWWKEEADLSPALRFQRYLFTELIQTFDEQLVIFFDEVDQLRDSRAAVPPDDFFGLLRSIYQESQRGIKAAYRRVSFVLIGCIRPSELIKSKDRTPLNVGQELQLTDFTPLEAKPFKRGWFNLSEEEARRVLDRVLHWTNGHPYLTQRLSRELAAQPRYMQSDDKIDELVNKLFLRRDVRDTNLAWVRDEVVQRSQNQDLFRVYYIIYAGHEVYEDDQTYAEPLEKLKLAGLIRYDRGRAVVRNRIYREYFDTKWINDTSGERLLTVTIDRQLAREEREHEHDPVPHEAPPTTLDTPREARLVPPEPVIEPSDEEAFADLFVEDESEDITGKLTWREDDEGHTTQLTDDDGLDYFAADEDLEFDALEYEDDEGFALSDDRPDAMRSTGYDPFNGPFTSDVAPSKDMFSPTNGDSSPIDWGQVPDPSLPFADDPDRPNYVSTNDDLAKLFTASLSVVDGTTPFPVTDEIKELSPKVQPDPTSAFDDSIFADDSFAAPRAFETAPGGFDAAFSDEFGYVDDDEYDALEPEAREHIQHAQEHYANGEHAAALRALVEAINIDSYTRYDDTARTIASAITGLETYSVMGQLTLSFASRKLIKAAQLADEQRRAAEAWAKAPWYVKKRPQIISVAVLALVALVSAALLGGAAWTASTVVASAFPFSSLIGVGAVVAPLALLLAHFLRQEDPAATDAKNPRAGAITYIAIGLLTILLAALVPRPLTLLQVGQLLWAIVALVTLILVVTPLIYLAYREPLWVIAYIVVLWLTYPAWMRVGGVFVLPDRLVVSGMDVFISNAAMISGALLLITAMVLRFLQWSVHPLVPLVGVLLLIPALPTMQINVFEAVFALTAVGLLAVGLNLTFSES